MSVVVGEALCPHCGADVVPARHVHFDSRLLLEPAERGEFTADLERGTYQRWYVGAEGERFRIHLCKSERGEVTKGYQFPVRIPDDLAEAVRAHAEQLGVSLNQYTTNALRQFSATQEAPNGSDDPFAV